MLKNFVETDTSPSPIAPPLPIQQPVPPPSDGRQSIKVMLLGSSQAVTNTLLGLYRVFICASVGMESLGTHPETRRSHEFIAAIDSELAFSIWGSGGSGGSNRVNPKPQRTNDP